MINEKIEIVLPDNIMDNWQEIINILSHTANIPATLLYFE